MCTISYSITSPGVVVYSGVSPSMISTLFLVTGCSNGDMGRGGIYPEREQRKILLDMFSDY